MEKPHCSYKVGGGFVSTYVIRTIQGARSLGYAEELLLSKISWCKSFEHWLYIQ